MKSLPPVAEPRLPAVSLAGRRPTATTRVTKPQEVRALLGPEVARQANERVEGWIRSPVGDGAAIDAGGGGGLGEGSTLLGDLE